MVAIVEGELLEEEDDLIVLLETVEEGDVQVVPVLLLRRRARLGEAAVFGVLHALAAHGHQLQREILALGVAQHFQPDRQQRRRLHRAELQDYNR